MTMNNDTKITMYKMANRLKERLGYSASKETEGFLAPSAIEEADKLIVEVCATSSETISKHLDTLNTLWETMRSGSPTEREAASIKVFATSHEIKDIGSLCGYDLIAYFAESLRDYIGKTHLNLQAQIVIVQAHLDAMKVVHHRGFKREAGPEAEELKRMVQKAIDKYQ
jgi:hypothetical protein